MEVRVQVRAFRQLVPQCRGSTRVSRSPAERDGRTSKPLDLPRPRFQHATGEFSRSFSTHPRYHSVLDLSSNWQRTWTFRYTDERERRASVCII